MGKMLIDAGCWMLDAGSAYPPMGGQHSHWSVFQAFLRPIRGEIRRVSYRNLDVWQLARTMTTEIHAMTIQSLPKYEMYEVGSQIRRSIKSVRANIVEGYGRRRYKRDFIRFLTYALSSCDETRDHLDVLQETGSLADKQVYTTLARSLEELGKKLNNFIASVERGHRSVRENVPPYADDQKEHSIPCDEHPASPCDEHPASSIQHPASENERPHR